MIKNKNFGAYGIIAIGALLLLFPAFYNGYPLVNADDGTYINSGFLLERPGDRPIVYGLLLRFFSLNGLSLWIVAFVQSYVVSWLLFKIIKKNVRGALYVKSILIYLLLTFFTSLSWITSEIIPDVCTPIAFMCFYLLFIDKNSFVNTLLYYGVFFTASATHMSHFMIFMLLIVFIFFIRKMVFHKEEIKKVKRTLMITALLSLMATIINSSVYTNSKHAFMMASLLDKGILKPYLNEKCPVKNYPICAYNADMDSNPNWFLWSNDSPLYKEGGWSATRDEYNSIISDILTTPEYLFQFLKASLSFTWQQLLNFKIGDGNFPFPKESIVYANIERHIPNDINAYSRAWQHQQLIVPALDFPNKIINYTVCTTLLLLVILIMIKRGQIRKEFYLLLLMTVAVIVINAWDCATFSNVLGRYQCRVMWLIPFCFVILLSDFLSIKSKNAYS